MAKPTNGVRGAYCNYHLEGLIHALRYRGMSHLIKPENAVEFAQRWLAGICRFEEFDPFVVASFEVRAKCSQLGIPDLGDCPLCAGVKYLPYADIDEVWIDGVSDLMHTQAQLRSLLPR